MPDGAEMPWIIAHGEEGDRLARERHESFVNRDPFPNIPPALLGSAAFLEYIRVTAMVHPFRGWNHNSGKTNKDLVKPASYEIRAGKLFFIFNDNGDLIEQDLTVRDGKHFIRLPPNSITFVSTEETFRLPNYIAVRFNLRIKHVHRGILLGTGPLIDPGYNKPILIPLHNLTDKDYFISLEEGLIWVEFTKVFPAPNDTCGLYNKFGDPDLPKHTKKDIRQFLFAASGGAPIRSSMVDVRRIALNSERRVGILEKTIRNIGIAGILAIVLTVAGLLLPTLDLVFSADSHLNDSTREIAELKRQVQDLEARLPRQNSAEQAKSDQRPSR